MTRISIQAELLEWACERAGRDVGGFARRIPQLPAWVSGKRQPTLKQLEGFARATHTPIGYFFLPRPPEEPMPIPDFRTVADAGVRRPSPDLLDTIHLCQQRQDWFRDFARTQGERPLAFVGAAAVRDDIVRTAGAMRTALGFDLEARRGLPTWTDALRHFIGQADAAGVLVMVSGVVGSNNRRPLDPQEFRGFALADPLAPLVFINGADTKAAQMFTLAHELAHLWLGETALSDAEAAAAPHQAVERWCNQVAAELLVPLEILRAEYDDTASLPTERDRLARRFKVSTLVILRRLHDAGFLREAAYWEAYNAEVRRLRQLPKGSGGNFYLTLGARASRRFTHALVASTLEGRSAFTEAFRLLGFSKMSTFRELAHSLKLGP